ncbi:hypothetical protein Q8W15_08390 [Photobacterium damselae subsp. piscicida]|uniref:Uncharacterized protein n=1 Tax=Photobacterium damsela subsp. piscicida TaxID=38294 RepID=A0A7L8A4A4_PHODP|nr:hypothetical protein [Photobacterium damselae]MBE8128163.1 hypothetical protein [Photobacterium damselae subsp. piscicida]MDP2533594.1 hypothetical protein [Photobacterium damselae subsp. piscicida]MDP2557349.1 hypothetical protein [Photobacterium damselae subsp. piscicida]MDP2568694.1 hypothetical protein [Photobacterium damselae subsp. piscicida]QOD52881.1 hypothetical protein IC628_01140 [Photobacterium damselae subsp. piscicida]
MTCQDQADADASKGCNRGAKTEADFVLQRTKIVVVTPIDLLMVKFTFYKRSNNLIVHLFAFRKTNGFSY